MQIEITQDQARAIRGMIVYRLLKLKQWEREVKERRRKTGEPKVLQFTLASFSQERQELESLIDRMADVGA